MYRQITKTWQKIWKEKYGGIKERAIQWRKDPTILRLDKPTRIDRARRLGYKAKQGMLVVRIKISRGGMRKSRPKSGRRPKHLGTLRIKAHISSQKVAERRVLKKFPNLHVLNSYLLHKDGKHFWFEVLLKDPNLIED